MVWRGRRGERSGKGRAAGSAEVSGTGDAAASWGGVANTGYLSVGTLSVGQRGVQEPAAWPHQVGVVPPAARSFQHRAEADRLRTAVAGGGTAVLSQVLTGMGGVGKTQLAAAYARAAWEDSSQAGGLDVLVWVTAGSRQAVVERYAQAGVELCRADPGDPQTAARTFLAWLAPKARTRRCRWLVVLDDVADPDDLRELWPPASPHGRVLVTTRRWDAALADGRRLVEVGLFTQQEAQAYLTDCLAAHGRTEPAEQIAALATELGRLPLALSQAAAYLADTGETVAAYRDLLADRTTTLADTAPDRLPDDQALPLAAAWSLSIEHADTLRPAGLARPMLHLASLLDANGIPQPVLTSAPARTYLAAQRTTASQGPAAEEEAPEPVPDRDAVLALRALHRLHLIEHTPGTPHQAVRTHQLVQRATRDTLTPHQHQQTAHAAADALLAAWPDIERDTDLATALRANTTALIACAEDALHTPKAHGALFRIGRSLRSAGQVAAVRDHFQRLTSTTTRHLGPDHLDALIARQNFAHCRAQAGDVAGATAAFAELLPTAVRVLGEDHPGTLSIRYNLAHWRGEAGDVAGAAAALAELLPDMVRVLGEDHPDTLSIRYNLAHWRGEAGDVAGAAAAFAELLPTTVRVLGEDHPDTLSALHNLACWRGEAGDAAGAAAALAELLDDRLRVLGKDHPDTLLTHNNLAFWRGEAGDAAGAAAAFAELLDDRLRVLGKDHPDTLTTRHNLARWRGEAGDAGAAAAAFAELLPDMARVLGKDHPTTLATRSRLAHWRGEAGDAGAAAAAFAELLPDMARVLGEDHPWSLIVRHGLTRWRGRVERTDDE